MPVIPVYINKCQLCQYTYMYVANELMILSPVLSIQWGVVDI